MSEFGKGLVICLVKFAEHAMKLRDDLELYNKMVSDNPKLFDESHAVEMWANGASDHLYEIEAPEGKDWDDIRIKVDDLKTLGLKMGHEMFGCSQYKADDAWALQELTREIALLIDEKLGLKPDLGDY